MCKDPCGQINLELYFAVFGEIFDAMFLYKFLFELNL